MSAPSARQPAPALLDLDGHAVRRLGADARDLEAVLAIHQHGANPLLLELPDTAEAAVQMLQQLQTQAFGLPLIVHRDGAPFALAATAIPNVKSLNAYLLFMSVAPDDSALALALCVRHVFWNFPLHRLYTHLPLTQGLEEYEHSFSGAGFSRDGLLPEHLALGGRFCDVASLGLLRTAFDAWCATADPRFSL